MKSAITKRVGLGLALILFILGNSVWAGVDPGNPDTAYVECLAVPGGTVIIKVNFVTDNTGDSNLIQGFGFPLLITNSNPAANPVLDTTVSATFSGSAVKDFSFLSTYVVPKIDSIACDTFVTCSFLDPCLPQPDCFCRDNTTLCCIDSIVCDTFEADHLRTFPLRYVLGAVNFYGSPATNIGAGSYLFANIVLNLQGSTTICIDTQSTKTVSLTFNTPASGNYTPQWKATFNFKQGDVNCSGGNPNLGDIVYLVAYIFKGGPAPCIKKLGDANCSGGNPNLGDIVYLVSYIFKGGPAPAPCP